MFCPECGIEERSVNQFCRACGTDLRRVRTAVEEPDRITAASISARDEIGRAIAAKIRDSRTADDLAVVAEDVLPQVEKFLESPDARRMRRMRTGTILACIGFAVSFGVLVIARFIEITDKEFVFIVALGGIVTFFVGLAFLVNGLFLTVPIKTVADHSREGEKQKELDAVASSPSDLTPPYGTASVFSSVTENTTRHLEEQKPLIRS